MLTQTKTCSEVEADKKWLMENDIVGMENRIKVHTSGIPFSHILSY